MSVIYASRYNKWKVMVSATITMVSLHLASVCIGKVIATLIPRLYIIIFGSLLFVVFGVLMLWEAYHMEDVSIEEKVKEAEEEIAEKTDKKIEKPNELKEPLKPAPTANEEDVEAAPQPTSPKKVEEDKGFFASPYFQLVVMMFFGEWGDRSQIGAVSLTASNNAWGVAAGGSVV